MAVITMKQLLEAGVHFGHQAKRWNPKMARGKASKADSFARAPGHLGDALRTLTIYMSWMDKKTSGRPGSTRGRLVGLVVD